MEKFERTRFPNAEYNINMRPAECHFSDYIGCTSLMNGRSLNYRAVSIIITDETAM